MAERSPARYRSGMTTKTILLAGFGPGISSALAERFGQAGFQLALVARNADKLAASVKALEGKGFRAQAFPADLSDPASAEPLTRELKAIQSRCVHANEQA